MYKYNKENIGSQILFKTIYIISLYYSMWYNDKTNFLHSKNIRGKGHNPKYFSRKAYYS